MVTKEGHTKWQPSRNPFAHTMGNGASLKEPIPPVYDYDIWGQYPWYESTKDAQPINKSEIDVYLIARLAGWFLARQAAPQDITGIPNLGKINSNTLKRYFGNSIGKQQKYPFSRLALTISLLSVMKLFHPRVDFPPMRILTRDSFRYRVLSFAIRKYRISNS